MSTNQPLLKMTTCLRPCHSKLRYSCRVSLPGAKLKTVKASLYPLVIVMCIPIFRHEQPFYEPRIKSNNIPAQTPSQCFPFQRNMTTENPFKSTETQECDAHWGTTTKKKKKKKRKKHGKKFTKGITSSSPATTPPLLPIPSPATPVLKGPSASHHSHSRCSSPNPLNPNAYPYPYPASSLHRALRARGFHFPVQPSSHTAVTHP